VRYRSYLTLLMPVSAALVIGVLVGAYVVGPVVGPAVGAVSPAPTARGIADAGATAAPAQPSGRVSGSPAGATPRPVTGGKPASSLGPVASPSPSPIPAAAEGVVPILYYHRVEGLPPGFAGWSKRSQDAFLVDDLLPNALIAQLDWLKANGYTTILPRDLAAHWDSGKPLPRRPIILTFDDGFGDWRRFILPQLQKRRMVAEFYVVLANVGRSITWDDVKALAKAGMGIGSHDVQHTQLAGGGVPTASVATMRYQVTESKRQLEAKTGVTVDSIAYVGGGYDQTLIQVVHGAGYLTARSIERGVLQTQAIRFHLHVSRVSWHDDVTDIYKGTMAPGLPMFAKRVSGANPG
jgi:peptidoglycan/xylan/chitin deacetylase (PgdA/CDA1 family)